MKDKLPLLFCLLGFCCQNKQQNTAAIKNDTLVKTDTVKERNYLEETLATIPKDIKPIMGYRFVVMGDFNGDGKKETLTERYVSEIDGKETPKFYDFISDQSQLIALQDKNQSQSFVSCSNKNIGDSLFYAKDGQITGFLLLKNEGDLNGDGKDELSYIRSFADWSTLNSFHIFTFTGKSWKEIYNTMCYDGDAPELYNIDISHKYWNTPIYINCDTLKSYAGLVKKIKPGLIAVNTYGEGMAYNTVDTVKLPLKIE